MCVKCAIGYLREYLALDQSCQWRLQRVERAGIATGAILVAEARCNIPLEQLAASVAPQTVAEVVAASSADLRLSALVHSVEESSDCASLLRWSQLLLRQKSHHVQVVSRGIGSRSENPLTDDMHRFRPSSELHMLDRASKSVRLANISIPHLGARVANLHRPQTAEEVQSMRRLLHWRGEYVGPCGTGEAQAFERSETESSMGSLLAARDARADVSVLDLGKVGSGGRRGGDVCSMWHDLQSHGNFSRLVLSVRPEDVALDDDHRCEMEWARSLIMTTLRSTLHDAIIIGDAVCDASLWKELAVPLMLGKASGGRLKQYKEVFRACWAGEPGTLWITRAPSSVDISKLFRFIDPRGLPPHHPPHGLYLSTSHPSQQGVMFVPEGCESMILPNPLQRLEQPPLAEVAEAKGKAAILRVGIAIPVVEYLGNVTLSAESALDEVRLQLPLPDRSRVVRDLVKAVKAQRLWSDPAWVERSVDPPLSRIPSSFWGAVMEVMYGKNRAVVNTKSQWMRSADSTVYAGVFRGYHVGTIQAVHSSPVFVPILAPVSDLASQSGISLIPDSASAIAGADPVTAFFTTSHRDFGLSKVDPLTMYVAWNLEYYPGTLHHGGVQHYFARAALLLDYSAHGPQVYGKAVAEMQQLDSNRSEGIAQQFPVCFHPAWDVVHRESLWEVGKGTMARQTVAAVFVGLDGPSLHRRVAILRHLRSIVERGEDPFVNRTNANITENDRIRLDAMLRQVRGLPPLGILVTGASRGAPISFGYKLWRVTALGPTMLNIHARLPPGEATLEKARIIPLVSYGTSVLVSERGTDEDRHFEDTISGSDGAIFLSPNRSDPYEVAIDMAEHILANAQKGRRAAVKERALAAKRRLQERYRCEDLEDVHATLHKMQRVLPPWYIHTAGLQVRPEAIRSRAAPLEWSDGPHREATT